MPTWPRAIAVREELQDHTCASPRSKRHQPVVDAVVTASKPAAAAAAAKAASVESTMPEPQVRRLPRD